jgi:hypothetical protein
MRFFERLGFRRRRGKKDFTLLATAGQRKVIWHLAEDLQWIPKMLFGFILKMTGKEKVEELTRKEAMKVTEGLKSLRNRGVKWN